jgi:hypothetical protein
MINDFISKLFPCDKVLKEKIAEHKKVREEIAHHMTYSADKVAEALRKSLEGVK